MRRRRATAAGSTFRRGHGRVFDEHGPHRSPAMTDHSQQGFATRAIHLGYDPLQEQGALSPPLYLTSTYTQESLEAFDEIRLGERSGYVYGRTRNPTQALLEERLALWRAPRPPSSPRPAWPRSRPRCSRCCKAATRSWSTRSSTARPSRCSRRAWRALACARCSPISRARRRWPPPSAPRPAPCISRRRPIPTCGWSTSRRCRPSRAARDC